MADHHPVVTTIGAGNGITVVHFYCPCGTNRREVLLDTSAHPAPRFTAAIRRLHERGQWPPADIDLGDAAAAGWGQPTEDAA